MENHPHLRTLSRFAYRLPGMKSAARRTARFGIQNLPLTRLSRQRLYNFVAADTIPSGLVTCEVNSCSERNLLLDLNLQDDISRQWYYWGYQGYEQATVRLFCELLTTKTRVFDVGANVGYYTLIAAAHLAGKGQVHAFEPNPSVFQSLLHNTQLNSFANVQLEQIVMSDTDGEVCFFLPPETAQSNGSLIRGFVVDQKAVLMKSMRFDSYCVEQGIERVDLVKIDVEGAELKVLNGMGDLVDQWTPDFILEVLQPFDASLDSFFTARDYRKFLITDDGPSEVNKIEAHPQCRDYYLSRSPLLN